MVHCCFRTVIKRTQTSFNNLYILSKFFKRFGRCVFSDSWFRGSQSMKGLRDIRYLLCDFSLFLSMSLCPYHVIYVNQLRSESGRGKSSYFRNFAGIFLQQLLFNYVAHEAIENMSRWSTPAFLLTSNLGSMVRFYGVAGYLTPIPTMLSDITNIMSCLSEFNCERMPLNWLWAKEN